MSLSESHDARISAIQNNWTSVRNWLDDYVKSQLTQHPEIDATKLHAMIGGLEAVSLHFSDGLESPEAFGSWIRESALWSSISSSWIALYNEDVFKACKSILGRFCKRGNWDDSTVEDLVQSAWMEVFKTAHILITLPEPERKKQIVDIAFSVSNKYKNSEAKRKKAEVSIELVTYKRGQLVHDPKKGTKKPAIEPEELPEPDAEPEEPAAPRRVSSQDKTKVDKKARVDGAFQLALADGPMSLVQLRTLAATRQQSKDRASDREVTFSLKRIGAVLSNGLYALPEPQLTQAQALKKAWERFQENQIRRAHGEHLLGEGDEEEDDEY